MKSISCRLALLVGAMSVCFACHCAVAEPIELARVVSSVSLPGGKHTVVYEYAGVEYMTISPNPPGEWIPVRVSAATDAGSVRVGELACPGFEGAQCDPPQLQPIPLSRVPIAPLRTEVLPVSSSYVGGFFIDPIAAVLGATGLGLLLNGGWRHNAGLGGR